MSRKLPHTALQAFLVCLLIIAGVLVLHCSDGSWANSSIDTGVMIMRSAGNQFVIADLDGDRKPDMASVEMGSLRSAKDNYSIRLQFGAGAKMAIGVSAPLGGLQVAARDVNGDDSVDLVLTSKVDAHFIEVLLNDGHGNFSLAAPDSFPNLENDSQAHRIAPPRATTDQDKAVSLRSPLGEEGAPFYRYPPVVSSDWFLDLENAATLLRLAQLRLGRSPPSPITL